MSDFEVFFKLESSDWNDGILLNKYGDQYSLLAAQEGKEGNAWKRWVFPQNKDREPLDKAIPMGVKLGRKDEAIELIEKIYAELTGKDPEPDSEDVPF